MNQGVGPVVITRLDLAVVVANNRVATVLQREEGVVQHGRTVIGLAFPTETAAEGLPTVCIDSLAYEYMQLVDTVVARASLVYFSVDVFSHVIHPVEWITITQIDGINTMIFVLVFG